MPWPGGLVVKNGSKMRSTHFGAHARAGVAHGEARVLAGRQVGSAVERAGHGLRIDLGARQFDLDEPAARRDGVRGVGGEIEHDLVDLGRVRGNGGHLRRHLRADLHHRRQGGARELQRFLHHRPEVDHLVPLPSAAG